MTIKPLNAEQRRALVAPRVEQRYRLLRVIMAVFYLIGIPVLVLGVAGGVLIAVTPTASWDFTTDRIIQGPPNVGYGVAIIAASLIGGLLCLAFAQLLDIQVSREEHARVANAILLELFRRRGS